MITNKTKQNIYTYTYILYVAYFLFLFNNKLYLNNVYLICELDNQLKMSFFLNNEKSFQTFSFYDDRYNNTYIFILCTTSELLSFSLHV